MNSRVSELFSKDTNHTKKKMQINERLQMSYIIDGYQFNKVLYTNYLSHNLLASVGTERGIVR